MEGFDAFRGTHPVGSRIKAYYGVSQTDRTRVEAIIDAEFADTPIDVIIDDASHLYRPTKEAFEIAFPRLKPGGSYVIEERGLAHWPGRQSFMGKTAMSLFIMELIMLCASRSDIISEVRVFPAFAFIKKAAHAPISRACRSARSTRSVASRSRRATPPQPSRATSWPGAA